MHFVVLFLLSFALLYNFGGGSGQLPILHKTRHRRLRYSLGLTPIFFRNTRLK